MMCWRSGVIHALQSRGQCQLLAVTITKDHPWAAEFVDAVNTFYGRGDIPIGIAHSGITNDEGKFLKLARVQDQGQLRFPHDLDGTAHPGRDGRIAQGTEPTAGPVGHHCPGRLLDEPRAAAGLATRTISVH